MFLKRKCVLLILIYIFSLSLLYAQEKSSEGSEPVYNLGEVIVTDEYKSRGQSSEIKADELEKSTSTDLINLVKEKVPSFYTSNNRLMGFGVADSGSAQMSIRGIGNSGWSPQTGGGPTTGIPILINGMDTSMMINNHPVADIFSMKNIRRVEVLYGPQPVLYGSSAMGGIINVITERMSTEGYETVLSASYGSYNSTDDYVSHMGKIGNFDYAGSYNFRFTEGHRDQIISGTNGDTKFTSKYRSHNGTVHTGYEFNKNWYLALDSYIMNQVINDPGGKGVEAEKLEAFDITRGGAVVSLGNNFKTIKGSLQLYLNEGKHVSKLPADNDRKKYHSRDSMYGVKLRQDINITNTTLLTAGGEYRYYGGESEDLTKAKGAKDRKYTDDEFINEMSLFALLNQRFFEIFTASGGARYTWSSEFGSYYSWQGGLSAEPSDNTRVYASAARGFKLPDIIQYYNKWMEGDKNLNETGIDLDPETYTVYEIGVEQKLFSITEVSLTGYRVYSKNKFTKEVVGMGITNWKNADDFNYNGIETTLKLTPLDWLAFTGGYSFIDNKQNGKSLPYVPKHRILSSASVDYMGFYAGLFGEYVREIYANEEERTVGPATVEKKKLDNHFVLNAKIAYSFLERYRVFANLNNLTNNKYIGYASYATPPENKFYDYPVPGFNLMAGITAYF